MGSVVIPHLETGWHVDQAILSEEERLVVIRFGRDHDNDCMRQDEVLFKIADRVKNYAVYVPHLNIAHRLAFRQTNVGYLESTWPTSIAFQTSTPCTNCTTHALFSFSGGTNTWCVFSTALLR